MSRASERRATAQLVAEALGAPIAPRSAASVHAYLGRPCAPMQGEALLAEPGPGEAWTEERVKAWLEEAADTLRRMPWPTGARPSTRTTASVDVVRDYMDAYGAQDAKLRPALPMSESITRLDKILAHVVALPVQQYRVIMLRLARRTWPEIRDLLGRSERGLRYAHAEGVSAICRGLNGAGEHM